MSNEPVTREWWLERFGTHIVELRDDFGLYWIDVEHCAELWAEGTGSMDQNYTALLRNPTRADIETIVRVMGQDDE